MATPLYTTDILRLATETLAWPRLDAPDLTAERRAPLCGSTLILDLALDDDLLLLPERVAQIPEPFGLAGWQAVIFGLCSADQLVEPAGLRFGDVFCQPFGNCAAIASHLFRDLRNGESFGA